MKLTYWVAERIGDHQCYSVIAKTKREAQRLVAVGGVENYEPIVKRAIEYTDAFDLFEYATSEGGGRNCGSLALKG